MFRFISAWLQAVLRYIAAWLQAATADDSDAAVALPQAAMDFPVTASLGPLHRPLHSFRATKNNLPDGVSEGEVRRLEADLEVLFTELKIVAEADDPSFTARCWMKEVRELRYDAEDFFNEVPRSSAGAGRSALLAVILWIPSKLKRRRQVAAAFSDLCARAKEASPRRQSFQLGPVTIKPVFGQANVSHSPKFIGLEESMDKLVKMLTFDSEGAEQQVQVVAIFGLAGVGKTTLARTFYRDFGGKYQCQAFVRVSRNPDTRMLLSSILSQIKAPLVHAFPDVQDLIDHIREYLRCKRYLIVIDDLWASSTWDVISRAFPDGDCCSRIIVTTEIEDVALACSRYQFKYIYEMGPLNGDQSRKLFLGRVFGSEDGCPPDFKDVAYEISRKCGGLPLATENIASMLACELDIDQWKYVRDSLPSILSLRTNPGSEGLKEVLNIIYSNLSPKLKTCLLYLTMYPEGYTISKDELVKQWVAEDFIGEGQDREKTARDYFDELVSRGMIQPVDRNYNDDVLTFTVHHMVLDLIRYKSLEENFIISVSCFQTTPGLPDKVRRLSVQFGGAKCANMPADFMMTQVRSLIFFGFLNCVPSFVEYKVLRVLILHIWADGSKIFDLTRIGELFQLRCLKIDCNITVHLPDEIRQLNSLETLELHAPVNGMPSDISCLPLLRTLGYFDLSKNSLENVWSLGELNNLQDLHLTWSNIAEPDNLKNNMQCLRSILWKLSNLKSLTLVPAASSDAGVLDNAAGASVGISGDVLSSVSSPPALLQRLELSGRCCIFSSLPEWTKELGNLCILKIAVRKLLRKDIDILKGLPALMALSLYVWTAPVGKIVFDNEGFSVLKYFKFTCAAPCAAFLKGAMPSVRQLKLAFNGNRMEQYSQIVAGLEYLIELKEITAKVGGTGADESDKRYVESALSGAIANHPCTPIIRVRCVDRIFCGEEDTSAATQEQEHWTLEKRHNKQEELLNPLPELISIPSTQTQTRDGGKNGGTERSREASAPPTAAMRRGRADAPADLGSVLGHPTPDLRNLYALGRKLGQGQFSTTYVCTELATGVEYACKSISKHKLIKEDIDDVRREIQIMHHLSGHKNVVAIKGAYEDQCYVHIVMELCAGGELFDRIIQRGHYSELKAVELTRIIVGVIEACHSLGVMHRDLKPENFLLANKDDDLSLKAIDFGLSVFFKPGQIFTDVVGSPYYIAPEVLGRKYGQEADLWTAGVILYILLSGVPPFWAETQQGIFDAILKGVIDFDSEPWPVISDSAKDLIRRMLNPRPAERLTAQEVLCHPWIRDHGVAPDRPLDRAVLSRIKHFSAMNKLKKMALRVIAESLSEEEIAGLKEMFQTMDTDNSGAITYDELKEGLRRYGSTLKDTEIRDLMEAADVDNSGTIDYMEFIAATLHLNKLEREEHLVAAFSYFDKDGSGYIRVDELQQACQEHNMPDAFLDDSIKEADQDNSLATPTKSGPRGGSRGKVVDEVNLMVVYEPTKPQENCKSREDTNMPAEEVPEAKKRKIAESTSGKEKLVSSENAEASLVRYKGSNSSTRGHCTEQTEQCKFYPPQSFSRHYPTNTTYLGKRSRAVDVASGAMGSLLDKLGKLVKGNYNLERSMKRDIESFSEDLAKIHIDLPYLEKLDGVEIWVDEVRELSYNIEDMVDSFMVRVEPDSSRSGFRELPHEGLKFLENDMTTQRQIGDVIKDIKNQVQAMVDRKKKYNFDVNNVVATATAKAPIDPRMAIYINKEQLIGIEERIDQLIRLFEEDGDVSKQELKTIFIVGMGGLGKTTLAKAVYDKLKKDYHHRAFIPVGQNPDVKKVLMDILFEFGQKSENLDLDVHQLIKKLRKLLKKERYFIVIDDIWDSSSWDLIASAFPKNNHGSRVITTTRIERVARACCEHERKYVYRMKPLSEEESRRLFLRRIFGHGKDCPDTPRKEEISKYILKKCGGMPLAINSIASLLGEEESTWEYIWKSLASVTEGNDLEKMKQILDLSYMHLPSDLKTCLLYVCMYPEDREIYKDDLLRLWVAEGFVSANSGPDAEDVANKYFNDLISTSMIQPGERDAYNNEVLSCRVHDIMLDLLRSKSSEENFIRVIDGSKYGTGKIRRVSFHNNDKNYMRIFETINKESLSQVRSVLLCQSSLAAYFLEKFKYVRVLHLERDNGFNHSLDLTGISKLFLLRYLKIACPHGGMCELKLPNQIGELQQLETIDLQGCYMEKYPSDIVSLPWLSHLSMTGIIAGVVLPDGIDRLTSLRTLAGVRLYESSVDSILGLGKLTNLRKLEICLYTGRGEAITARHMDALRSSISILSTNLMICTFRERFPLKYVLGWSSRTLFPGDSQIRELHLGGCIFRRCPKCIRQLHKLYKFSIWVREVADGISIVAGLRSLAYFS